MDGSLGEAIVRASLAELFPEYCFVKTRQLDWLEGHELDCFNQELRLAFEYQGVQHYEYVPFFHDNDPERFEAQKRRDQFKREAAHDAWIVLVEVPHTVPHREIRDFVLREVLELGYNPSQDFVPVEDLMASARINGALAVSMLAKARTIAASHGGECLSEVYIECHSPLRFRCAKGHEFATPLASVNHWKHPRPRFCPECGGTRRRTEVENRELVTPSGYELLRVGTVTIGREGAEKQTTSFHVRCPAGHEYEVLRANFLPVVDGKPKRGCIRCARTRTNQARGSVERAQRALKLGLRQIGPFTKRKEDAEWECLAAGHRFTASWATVAVRKGRKCLLCS